MDSEGRTSRAWSLLAQIISAMGGLAGVLAWLGVQPWHPHLNPTIPHVGWLIIGLVLFAVSLASSVRSAHLQGGKIAQVEGSYRERLYRADISNSAERLRDTEAHEAELRTVTESLERCEAERRQASEMAVTLKAQLDVFSPLQLDAIRLAKNLIGFLGKMGPPPAPKYSREQIERLSAEESKRLILAEDGDFAEAYEYHYGNGRSLNVTPGTYAHTIVARIQRLWPFYEKLRASYELDFADQVKDMWNRFAADGLADDRLRLPVDGRDGGQNVQTIAATLWELAFKQEERIVSATITGNN